MSLFKGSPYRRHRNNNDVESGGGSRGDEDEESSDPFDITSTKNASIARLRKWRQAALVLNASRRFRYTLDLKREEEKQQLMRKVRVHVEAIRAANLFKAAGAQRNGTVEASPPPPAGGHFAIGQEQLAIMSRDHDISALQQCGGAKKGIKGDDADLLKRKNAFGSNTYPKKKGRSFWRFLWEAWQDLTLIILIVAAAASLALGIKSEMLVHLDDGHIGVSIHNLWMQSALGIKEGWYDGGSIAFAVILVIVVTAISDYKQSLQFQSLNEEKRNIHMEVPADGVLISGHSLAIDESKSKAHKASSGIYHVGRHGGALRHVRLRYPLGVQTAPNSTSQGPNSANLHLTESKQRQSPPYRVQTAPISTPLLRPFPLFHFLLLAGHYSRKNHLDGGHLIQWNVTSVGINTEWGMLMASISEDTGEETPLQVRLNGVATLIGMVGLTVAVCVLIVLLVRYFTGHTKDASGNIQFIAGKTKLSPAIDGAIKIVTVAVTIVVVAVPEGLPLAVTLTLAYSMRKMMADKALVRRLSACETMGSATTICSDKTGTLTLNQMTVVEACVGGKKIDSPENKSEWPSMLYSLLIEGIAQNTTGSVYVSEGGGVELSGSPTEKAILNLGVKLGMNFEAIRSESSVIRVFPFNSDKKRGGIALKLVM
ncbi:calcium-transporting atpase 10 [Quercus suber]|uniref:Calcium-transporting atpase 10 n=1 Tax=Quercus suber TaxID=58331 RepID=A0AAW0J1F4_QUESU